MASVHIVGVRGIPNRYGGFERLIEVLAPYLVTQGHEVTVYCESLVEPQALAARSADTASYARDVWQGVQRVFIPVDKRGGARSTLIYDWRAISLVPAGAVALIFGYGTAIYQLRLRWRGVPHAVNMDGIEWQREKWGRGARKWLRLNEHVAARWSDILIADHPTIQDYLRDRLGVDSTMIAYGVDLMQEGVESAAMVEHELLQTHAAGSFDLIIARPEPENQIHLLLEAHARVHARGCAVPMVVVGNFDGNPYGQDLQRRYPHVTFAGPIYHTAVLNRLRAASRYYLHGHSVGGTNPSLIEAMAAGSLIVAHDNPFNRWVLGDDGGYFFHDVDDLAKRLGASPTASDRMACLAHARESCRQRFLWSDILAQYHGVVCRLLELGKGRRS